MAIVSEEELSNILNEVIERFILPKYKALGWNATGEWKSNLGVRTEIGDSKATGYVRGRDYTDEMEHGTPAGTDVSLSELQTWVTAKFGYSGKRARTMAYLVKRKIENEGSKRYRQGGEDLIEILNSNEVISFINQRLGDSTKQRMQREMKIELSNIF